MTAVVIRSLTQTYTCEMDSSIFSTMSWLKFVITTRTSFLSVPSTEIKRIKKFLLVNIIALLVLLLLSHQVRSGPFGSLLYELHSNSPSLASIMASGWLYHKPRMRTPSIVSDPPFLWRTSYFDILQPWWMRGLPHTQWGKKYFCVW